MENSKMQTVIDKAKRNGFICLEEETTQYNYEMALEFLKLSPSQQMELAQATGQK